MVFSEMNGSLKSRIYWIIGKQLFHKAGGNQGVFCPVLTQPLFL